MPQIPDFLTMLECSDFLTVFSILPVYGNFLIFYLYTGVFWLSNYILECSHYLTVLDCFSFLVMWQWSDFRENLFFLQKFAGCNKMVCSKCHSCFCWLCLKILHIKQPYEHFRDASSRCYNRLHGVAAIDDEEEEGDNDDNDVMDVWPCCVEQVN